MLPKYSWMHDLPLETDQFTRDYKHSEKTVGHFPDIQQLSIAPQLVVKLYTRLSASCWNLVSWGFIDLVHIVANTVNLFVQLSCGMQKTVSL